MRHTLQTRLAVRLGLAALTLALELTVVAPSSALAQSAPNVLQDPSAQPVDPASAPVAPAGVSAKGPGQQATSSVAGPNPPCPGSMGPADYPVSGGPTDGAGWFYTQEACAWPPVTGLGPARQRGFAVLDDSRGAFWTEFRRFGGVDVLGYPVSQPYLYDGLWQQAFERGILRWHPDQQRAEMANAFEQFTENNLDRDLEYFGIPGPQQVSGLADIAHDRQLSYEQDQRMGWVTDPQMLARFFYDPVAFHSSEPGRPGQTTFAFQEQAWAFFGLPQSTAQRLNLEAWDTSASLWPLVHTFMAQRFQKSGMELFMEDLPPSQEQFIQPLHNGDQGGILFDPTIVPGDGKKGCVALTAVGLLAREIGTDKMIPRDALQPQPLDPSPKAFFTQYVPDVNGDQMVSFQLNGTNFGATEPVTVMLTDGVAPDTAGGQAGRALPPVTARVDHTSADGSFSTVIAARVGTYTVTATGTRSGKTYSKLLNLAVPTINLYLNRTTSCTTAGLPVAN
jgi:hypothetical protein